MGAKSELCEEHCLGHGELAFFQSTDIGMIFSRCLQLHRRLLCGSWSHPDQNDDAELRPRAKTCPQFFNSLVLGGDFQIKE